MKLSSYGLEARTEEINAAAVGLARAAAGDQAHVTGAIGPLGIRIEPWGPTARDEASELFARQVSGLLEGGVDGFVLETFADIQELECALQAVRGASDLPVFAQMTVGPDRTTSYGADPHTVARSLQDMGVDVAGLNCSVGPAVLLDALEDMAESTSLPGIHGPVCPAHDRCRRPVRGWVLRHHPRPHPDHGEDRGLRAAATRPRRREGEARPRLRAAGPGSPRAQVRLG